MGQLIKQGKSWRLHRRFARLGELPGYPLDYITRTVGAYTSARPTVITDRNNAPGTLCTWARSHYSITLLFDQDNICVGIAHETKNYL